MIKIKSSKDEIIINGHSEYAEKGYDIVCSAVSTMVITTVNGLLSYDSSCLKYEENGDYCLKIIILKHDEVVDIFINNLINLLKELENDYKNYIKFIK